ncbi:MAG: pectin acetylesterase-family hydrolase, partial [Myxococcota bacterium]
MKRLVIAMTALALAACGDDDTEENTDTVTAAETETAFAAAEASPGSWIWVPVGGAKCRDGSDTGFLVRLQPNATEWFMYLEGGGACFNSLTCLQNPSSFGPTDVSSTVDTLSFGLFDDANVDNPVAGWNAAYVPYCSGDVFAGSREGVAVPGVSGTQDFVGARNVSAITDLLATRYSDASRVLLTGSSAGGFGAAFNYDRVATRFAPTRVDLLNDSGQPFAFGDALSSCLAAQWFDLWGIEFPSGCTTCGADQEGIFGYAQYITDTYPNADFALSSYTEDEVIRFFFAFGKDACEPMDFTPISGVAFSSGLFDIRTGLDRWATFYATGSDHTFLRFESYQSLVV